MKKNQLSQLDEISLQNLEVRCLVGIYPRERLEPQPVILNLSLYLDTRRAARQRSLDYSVDYAALSEELKFLLQNSRFRLLETAVDAIAHYVLSAQYIDRPLAPIEAVRVSIEKPKALPGCTLPRLSILRAKEDLTESCRYSDKLCVVHKNPDSAIVKLQLGPGETSLLPTEPNLEVVDTALSPWLLGNGEPWAVHQVVPRSTIRPRVVVNQSTKETGTLLTVLRRKQDGQDISDDFYRLFSVIGEVSPSAFVEGYQKARF
ncbi:dihydroneopterin aldolase [Pseudobacteriovorax antillogorgiicola]|uniref:dihydroneopterin aldolase n=1 Tax=Pseudobacteriovorax antillogorgiicola TaxID=1513793 RepID=A0A1Y6CSL8_9BACT|nr:dihydroneopterin aldolase [Pseudobacteriovorax antillogorgiicola]TCS45018.1 dihydroneopterin aldolase [Pseudobacteriovorax antillogorgiicola]SMF76345.1 dihydroneopterin aldolase [Pseudobacteriovorax antillogorgiicola]